MRHALIAAIFLAGCSSSEPKAGSETKVERLIARIADTVTKEPRDPDEASKKQRAELERLGEEVLAEVATPAGKQEVRRVVDRKIKELRSSSVADRDSKVWALLEIKLHHKVMLDAQAAALVEEYMNAAFEAPRTPGNKALTKAYEEEAKKAEGAIRERCRTADGREGVLDAIDAHVDYNDAKQKVEASMELEEQTEILKALKKRLG
jgi:membrane-bound lytic murein transglycosylase